MYRQRETAQRDDMEKKEREEFMTKKRIVLLLGLVLVLSLITVTAWATLPPTEPDQKQVLALTGNVRLQCRDHPDHSETFDYYPSGFSVSDRLFENGEFICTLTVFGESFLHRFNRLSDQYHHILAGSGTLKLRLKYDAAAQAWVVADEGFQNGSLTFAVICAEPAAPTAAEMAQMPLCAAVSDLDNYDHRQYALDPGALDFENGWSYWVEYQDMWGYCVPFDATDIIRQYNRDTGRNNLLVWGGHITLYYQNGAWTYIEDDALSEGQIAAAPAPTAEELKEMGLRVYVCCAESKHDTKSDFPLPTDGQLTFTPVWNKVEQRSEYCVSLTAAAADSYVAQYSAAVGKDHTRIYTGNAILYWYDGGAAVYADAEPPLDPPVRQRGWYLDRTELDLAAECRDDPIIPARRPGRRTGQQVIESAKTCDGGIALYAGLSLLSLTGSAVLGKKKF